MPAQAGINNPGTGGTSTPTGRNQVGLNGINYFSNIKPFTNWFNLAQLNQVNVTGAITSITQTGGTATITTTNAHGFYNGTGSVSGWNLSISGANQAGYNLSGAIFTVTGANTITYPVNSGTVSPATGTITYLAIQFASIPANSPNSAFGQNNTPNAYLDNNGMPIANVANATTLQYFWLYHAINGTSYQPPGYTRNGQALLQKWTDSGGGGQSTGTWATANDIQNLQIVFNMSNPAVAPTSIFFGLSDLSGNPATDNYAAWQAGQWVDSAYINQLKASSGVVRFMDWQNTNQNYTAVHKYSDIVTTSSQAWGSINGMPVAVMCQVANKTTKHPWFNIPWALGQSQFNNTITSISKTNPAVVTFSAAHTFHTGDQVIGNLIGGSGSSDGSFGASAVVTFNVPGSFVTWAGNTFAAGQNIQFFGTTRYVTNVGTAGAGTFQLAANVANALAGTAIAFTGSSGSTTASSQVNRVQFTVGATTTYTLELAHCDSTSYGTAPTFGDLISPFILAGMTTEITNYVTAAKNGLNGGLIPRFEFGNEMWNSIFGGFAWNSSQAHNFVNTSTGIQNFSNLDDNNAMQGYLAAHVMKTVRDVYGGAGGRALWQGILATQSANSGVTAGMLTGIDYYLTNVLSNSLTRNDLFDDIAVTGYYGAFFVSNGAFGSFPGVTISVASPSTVTAAGNTLPIGTEIIFTTSGTLPTDAATGQPLVRGDMSASFSNISGFYSGTTFTVTAITGTPLTVGMTIWGNMAQTVGTFVGTGVAVDGVLPSTILSFGTGAGGTGTYTMSVSQTAGSVGTPKTGLQAMNMTLNAQVYYTLDTGSPFRFSATKGGSPINISVAGSGTHNCLSGRATLLCSLMNQSVALNASTPATFPSRYSFWNTQVNSALFGDNRVGWFPHVTYAVTTGATMPSVLGMVQYEGGQSDEPQGNAPFGGLMTANPMFQEFWPQAVGTTEDAANWTSMVSQWSSLTAYAIAQSLPNAAALVTSYPSKFTDATNISYQFGFGALTFVDHFQGIGFPTWQNQSINSHALYDAVVATN